MLSSLKPQKSRVAFVVSQEGLEGVYVMAGNVADQAKIIRIVNSIQDDLAVLIRDAVTNTEDRGCHVNEA